MKRDEALAPLSREHHSSLILAQLLKKSAPDYRDLPGKPVEKAVYAMAQYEANIKDHFIKEEVILERMKGLHPEIARLTGEIKDEHVQLRALFKSLNTADDLENRLNLLGNLLYDHIRKEERVLFPLLQENYTSELKGAIDDLLH